MILLELPVDLFGLFDQTHRVTRVFGGPVGERQAGDDDQSHDGHPDLFTVLEGELLVIEGLNFWKTSLSFCGSVLFAQTGICPTTALSNLDFRVATVARPWVVSLYTMRSHALASVATTLALNFDKALGFTGFGSRLSV